MGKGIQVIRSFSRTFWTANTMELFERMAWYGMFIMLANYLTGSTESGALGFSQSQKGLMMSTLAGLVYFLPIITGAIADRFGYKKVLLVSYFILIGGYLLLSVFKTFWPIYFSFIYLAVGAAFFKPVISATISKTTDENSSSIGFGIFYMLVNIGAFIGPFIGAKLKIISYDLVFYSSALAIGVNALLVLVFFKEPEREVQEESLGNSLLRIFRNIWEGIKDWKFMLFLIIIGGFWSMYNQLFYTFPVYIDQWVNLHQLFDNISQFSPFLGELLGNGQGKIESEMLVNLDAMYIVIFQIFVSSMVMKFKPLNTMMVGIFICAIGIGLTVATNDPLFMVLSIFLFALGEMTSSPKITEYIGRIAPKEKVALYMGFSFFPMFIGNVLAGVLSGPVYERISDKYTLLSQEILDSGIHIDQAGIAKEKLFEEVALQLNMSSYEFTQYLFDKYEPNSIWIIFTGIGITASILLLIYDRVILKSRS